jgi:hypothetical protein
MRALNFLRALILMRAKNICKPGLANQCRSSKVRLADSRDHARPAKSSPPSFNGTQLVKQVKREQSKPLGTRMGIGFSEFVGPTA